MRDLDKAALDRWITGNWGEDQLKEDFEEENYPEDIEPPVEEEGYDDIAPE